MTKSSVRNMVVGSSVIVFGVFLFMTYLSHNTFAERSNADKITERVALGKHVWEKHACIDCHTLLGEGAYYAPELGNVIKRRGEEGTREILQMAAEQGWGTDRRMPQFDLSEEEIEALVEFFTWMGNVDTDNWPPNIEG